MLKSGDKLLVKTSLIVRATGQKYETGEIFTLVEPTDLAPYGYKSHICNWIVQTSTETSVWSSIWVLVDYGWLERIPNESSESSH